MRTSLLAICCLTSTALADSKAPPPPPPPPPPTATIPKGAVTISAKAFEALRISGSASIEPRPETRAAMRSDRVTTVKGEVKVCLSTAGGVVHAEVTKSTGYPSYDRWIAVEVVDWMFRPHKQNARAVPACSTVPMTYTDDQREPVAPKRAEGQCRLGDSSPARLRTLRADVDMICGAARATSGKDFMSMGPYIAERMKTDLLADLFANLRTTTTLDMIVSCVRSAMARTNVKTCKTIDVLLVNRPR